MRALVIGASGGIGEAVLDRLQATGWQATGLSRRADGLELTDEASVHRVLAGQTGPFDLCFVATGVLTETAARPEKSLREVTAEELIAQYRINAIGPLLVLKAVLPLMRRDGQAVFAALSARVGSIGDNRLGGWHSYRASKAGLNQLLHGAAIELARSHPQLIVAALHPGTVATRFTENYAARHARVPPEKAASALLQVIEGLTRDMSGGFYDYAGKSIPW